MGGCLDMALWSPGVARACPRSGAWAPDEYPPPMKFGLDNWGRPRGEGVGLAKT